MSEELLALNKRFYEEVMNGRNLDAVDELVGEDFVDHEEMPGISNDRAGLKQFLQMMFTAFPEGEVTMEDVAVEGDKVWTRGHIKGKHDGELMGIPPTGKSVEFESIDIVRVKDGKAVEHWGITDMAGLMMQLGVLPDPTA
jgi:steroid delta-isomerase-like uncharacterized protein